MRSALIWQNPQVRDSRVLIEAGALESMDQYRQNREDKPEAGGILLGYRREAHLHVTMVTVPQPSDRRLRFWFRRSASYHQQVALREWKSSNMTMDYLGEWHSHPEPHPSPSSLDLSEWRKIWGSRSQSMLFAILGWDGELWLGLSCGDAITPCVLIDS